MILHLRKTFGYSALSQTRIDVSLLRLAQL